MSTDMRSMTQSSTRIFGTTTVTDIMSSSRHRRPLFGVQALHFRSPPQPRLLVPGVALLAIKFCLLAKSCPTDGDVVTASIPTPILH